MKSIYKIIIILSAVVFLFAACNEEYGPRKDSKPVIESATVEPANFVFGDSIVLRASLTDPETVLSMLSYEMFDGERLIVSGNIPINGSSYEVEQAIYVPLLANQADNANIQINLLASNILKETSTHVINGLSAKRPMYNQLYLVTDDGAVTVLKPQSGSNLKFAGEEMTLDPSFQYKIAEKINTDNSIDYSGDVYGNLNGKVSMIDERGESLFTYAANADYTKSFVFDTFEFQVTAAGSQLGAEDLALSSFGDADVDGETMRTLKRTLEKGKTYTVFGKLADVQNLYNPDFFERVADNKVKFIGETKEYTIYYNAVRKNIIVGVDNPSYPDYLLLCGWGLGYPTHVSSDAIGAVYNGHQRTHTDWGFDHVLKYVLMPRISEGVYQGTYYTPGDRDHYAGFKPFENTGWGNEKKAGNFTFTGVQIIKGSDNWDIPNGADDDVIEPANYRFTIDLNKNSVHIEKVNL